MKKAISTFTLILSAAVSSFGCGSDETRTVYVDEEDPYAYEPAEPDAGPFVPPFEAFDIPIGQSITVGAFVLQLDSLRVEPRDALYGPYAKVLLAFRAHNASDEPALPFSELSSEGLVLEVGGEYFWGHVEAAAVPGLRDGSGTLSWAVTKESSPALLAGATITLGGADQNQAVIPLAAAVEAVTLADLPVAGFTIVNGEGVTLEVTDARVQFNSRSSNQPLATGTAWLFLEGVISAPIDVTQRIEPWDDEDFYLQRPDGVSVVGETTYTPLSAGSREDLFVRFEIEQPVEGTYTLGITRQDQAVITQTVVVP